MPELFDAVKAGKLTLWTMVGSLLFLSPNPLRMRSVLVLFAQPLAHEINQRGPCRECLHLSEGPQGVDGQRRVGATRDHRNHFQKSKHRTRQKHRGTIRTENQHCWKPATVPCTNLNRTELKQRYRAPLVMVVVFQMWTQNPSAWATQLPKIVRPARLQKLVGEFLFEFWEGHFAGNLAGILRGFFGPTK